MKVTFFTEKHLEQVAVDLSGVQEIGAQYDVEHEGHVLYAVVWTDRNEWYVVDRLPIPVITLDWPDALPTLSEVFGLYIPCTTPL